MRLVLASIFTFGVVFGVTHSPVADAKCYKLHNTPSGYFFCVKGDSFSDRKKARACCKKVLGSSKCGSVSSYSSSCHSNINKCYDQGCNAKRSLRGYATPSQAPDSFKAALDLLM